MPQAHATGPAPRSPLQAARLAQALGQAELAERLTRLARALKLPYAEVTAVHVCHWEAGRRLTVPAIILLTAYYQRPAHELGLLPDPATAAPPAGQDPPGLAGAGPAAAAAWLAALAWLHAEEEPPPPLALTLGSAAAAPCRARLRELALHASAALAGPVLRPPHLQALAPALALPGARRLDPGTVRGLEALATGFEQLALTGGGAALLEQVTDQSRRLARQLAQAPAATPRDRQGACAVLARLAVTAARLACFDLQDRPAAQPLLRLAVAAAQHAEHPELEAHALTYAAELAGYSASSTTPAGCSAWPPAWGAPAPPAAPT